MGGGGGEWRRENVFNYIFSTKICSKHFMSVAFHGELKIMQKANSCLS
jgi:hypothetical protein